VHDPMQLPTGEIMTTPLYFDAYTTAIETYPDDNVELKIVDVTLAGSVLNAHETATFNVKVINNGPITLKDVRVKIEALNGTQVHFTGGAAGFFGSITTGPLGHDVLENQSKKFDLFLGKPPFELKAGAAQSKAQLIKVTLEDWTADLTSIYTDHTDARPTVSDGYSAEVNPV